MYLLSRFKADNLFKNTFLVCVNHITVSSGAKNRSADKVHVFQQANAQLRASKHRFLLALHFAEYTN